MNHAFYKILKFEFKQNFTNWMILLGIFFSIMLWLTLNNYINERPFMIGGSIVPLMILFSTLLTLHSYSESTTRQSMEMYHLLPVSRNTKFFSKQLITLVIFPVVIVFIYLLFAKLFNPLVFGDTQRSLFSPNFKPGTIALLFIWAHSFATFFAISFKKRKLLNAIAGFFSLQLIVMICFVAWKAMGHSVNNTPSIALTSNFAGALSTPILIAIPLLLYILSYLSFFWRQL